MSPAARAGTTTVQAGGDGRAAPRSGSNEDWKPQPLASLVAAAELLAADLLAGELTSSQLKTITRQVVAQTGLPVGAVLPALHALVARDTRLLACEASAAAAAQLNALLLFAPVGHASLWFVEHDEAICAVRVGASPQIRRLRAVARRVIAG